MFSKAVVLVSFFSVIFAWNLKPERQQEIIFQIWYFFVFIFFVNIKEIEEVFVKMFKKDIYIKEIRTHTKIILN